MTCKHDYAVRIIETLTDRCLLCGFEVCDLDRTVGTLGVELTPANINAALNAQVNTALGGEFALMVLDNLRGKR